MLRTGLLIVALYLVSVCEPAATSVFELRHVTPDLYALLAVIALTAPGGSREYLWSGLIGCAADLGGPGRMGTCTLSFLIVGYVLSRWRGGREYAVLPAILVTGPAVCAMLLGAACLKKIFGELPLDWTTLVARCLGAGAYTAVVAVPTCLTIAWTADALGQRRRRHGALV